MRFSVDEQRLRSFMEEIGKSARSPGRIYLVGGSTALLLGIRSQTVDIDIKLDPEPAGVFEAIAALKERLSINVELASPDDFLPALPSWRERSEFIWRAGQVEFFHYDFYGQALAKVLRGHEKDLEDARALVALGKVEPAKLLELYREIVPDIIRYPAINSKEFESRVLSFVEQSS